VLGEGALCCGAHMFGVGDEVVLGLIGCEEKGHFSAGHAGTVGDNNNTNG